MPCTGKRARLLLERGRAVAHKMAPFTTRLKDRLVEDSVLSILLAPEVARKEDALEQDVSL